MLRGNAARRVLKEQRRQDSAVVLQKHFRGWQAFRLLPLGDRADEVSFRLARRDYSRDRRRVILLQSCVRRRQAKKELKHRKAEAKSASHFKEASYRLENKVVELTQTLQKRTVENKALQAKLRALEDQLQGWISKYEDADSKAKALKSKADEPMVALPVFEALKTQRNELDDKLLSSLKKIEDQEYVCFSFDDNNS